MIKHINLKFNELEVPGIRIFANEVAKFEDGVNFTIGEPDFPTPDSVKMAGISAIIQNKTGYSHNAGLLELRQEVSNFFNDTYDFYYNPENEIVITTGASEAIDAVFRTILLPGDEVIVPAPIYSGYEPLIHLAGAKQVLLDTTQTNFAPTAESIQACITPQTKAILLNFPSNPTGMTIPKSEMDAIVELLKEHEIFIISDEIYSENTFNKKHLSFGSYPEIRKQLFILHGVSKSHAMTGWRIGYVLGDAPLMAHVLKAHLFNSICAALPSQYAAIEALRNNRHTPEVMNAAYIERRNYVFDRLQQMGFKMDIPHGAFYIFPSIAHTGMKSWDFATKLLEEKHVAVVPGSAFSIYGEGYIRISYANSMQQLKEGLDRLEEFLQSLESSPE